MRASIQTVQAKAPQSVIRSLRRVAEASLLGAVTAGMLFGWTPIAASVDVHAIGAIAGAGLGIIARARQFI